METRGNYFLVGLFIIILAAGGIIFGTWVLGANKDQNYIPLAVYFTGSVNGINPGSPVKYRGVQVGKVNKVSLDPEHPQYVLVMTEVEPHTPLRLDTKASLQMTGITGLAYVELEGSSNTAAPLKPQSGKKYLVIYAEESVIQKFVDEFPELLNKFGKVATQLQNLLDQENVQALSHTFKNVESITQNIVNHEKNINQIFNDMQNTLESLQKNSTESFHEFNYFLREGRDTTTVLKDLAKSLQENPSQIIYQPKYHGYDIEE